MKYATVGLTSELIFILILLTTQSDLIVKLGSTVFYSQVFFRFAEGEVWKLKSESEYEACEIAPERWHPNSPNDHVNNASPLMGFFLCLSVSPNETNEKLIARTVRITDGFPHRCSRINDCLLDRLIGET